MPDRKKLSLLDEQVERFEKAALRNVRIADLIVDLAIRRKASHSKKPNFNPSGSARREDRDFEDR